MIEGYSIVYCSGWGNGFEKLICGVGVKKVVKMLEKYGGGVKNLNFRHNYEGKNVG